MFVLYRTHQKWKIGVKTEFWIYGRLISLGLGVFLPYLEEFREKKFLKKGKKFVQNGTLVQSLVQLYFWGLKKLTNFCQKHYLNRVSVE